MTPDSSDSELLRPGYAPIDPATLPDRPTTPPKPVSATVPVPAPTPAVETGPRRSRTPAAAAVANSLIPWLGLLGILVAWLGVGALAALWQVPGFSSSAPGPLTLLAYGWLPVALVCIGLQSFARRYRFQRTLRIHRAIIVTLSVLASLAGIAYQVKRWL